MGWKDWSCTKKGLILGLIISALWFGLGFIGILSCSWNPVEGSVVPEGFCSSGITLLFIVPIFLIFPVLLILNNLITEPFGLSDRIMYPILLIFSTIFWIIAFSLIGVFIGWIVKKIKRV